MLRKTVDVLRETRESEIKSVVGECGKEESTLTFIKLRDSSSAMEEHQK